MVSGINDESAARQHGTQGVNTDMKITRISAIKNQLNNNYCLFKLHNVLAGRRASYVKMDKTFS